MTRTFAVAAWVSDTEQEGTRERQAQGGGWVGCAMTGTNRSSKASASRVRCSRWRTGTRRTGNSDWPALHQQVITTPRAGSSQRCCSREFRTFLDTLKARMAAELVVDNLYNQQDPCLDALARPLRAI